jgi:NAD(P)-dependent dehydrogenase (short-subunit alcohol dehydrogenase family)
LVNNAGVAFPGPVEELRLQDMREQFEVNVFGHLHLVQRLLPLLRASRGRIVFISSDRAERCVPMYGAYVASKRALNAFAETLAAELQPGGVSVAIVELGSFESNIRTAIRSRLQTFEGSGSAYGDLLRDANASLGQPPLGAPDEAAGAVLELLNGDSPSLLNVFPPSSQAKVIHSQLEGLQRMVERLLRQIERAAP